MSSYWEDTGLSNTGTTYIALGSNGCVLVDAKGEQDVLHWPKDIIKVTSVGDGIYWVMRGNHSFRHEIIDRKGLFHADYDRDFQLSVGEFREGLMPLRQSNGYGVVDRYGNSVIMPVFQWVDPFFEGKAGVRTDRGEFFFVNDKGRVVSLRPNCFLASPFCEGLAAATNGKGWWYIRPDGSPAFPRQFLSAADFCNGLARVKDRQTELFGYVDKRGNYVIAPQFVRCDYFSESVASVVRPKDQTRAAARQYMGVY